MSARSLYDPTTGMFTGQVLTGNAAGPADLAEIEGVFDSLSQRVNLATGQVEDYQPPAPADDELRTWAWDEATRRWVAQPTLAALKIAARERIKAAREAAVSEPKVTAYGIFDATLEARSNLAGVVAMAQTAAKLGLPSTVSYTLADNTRPEFTLEQLEYAALQVGAQVQACYDHAEQLFQQIEAATTAEQLDAVQWTS